MLYLIKEGIRNFVYFQFSPLNRIKTIRVCKESTNSNLIFLRKGIKENRREEEEILSKCWRSVTDQDSRRGIDPRQFQMNVGYSDISTGRWWSARRYRCKQCPNCTQNLTAVYPKESQQRYIGRFVFNSVRIERRLSKEIYYDDK